MKKIILTGGGTAGHITPNLALLPALKKENYEVYYIGAKNSMEKELAEKAKIPFYSVSTGKLRRYFSFKNFSDMFSVISGIKEAATLIKRISPDVIFSKGGFVAVPVVLGARLCRVPVIIHESDITPGLANKIAIPFAKKVLTTFPETVKYVKGKKAVVTGAPIRETLFSGDKQAGLDFCGLKNGKPVVMIMGGSQGSVKINTYIRKILPKLTLNFQIIHICGKGNLEKDMKNLVGYCQKEYVYEELPDLFAASDVLVSRAGSNSISEFLALKKPNLLIPLSRTASRGDQILNAESFRRQGFSKVLNEEDMTEESLFSAITLLYSEKDKYIKKMEESNASNGVYNIINEIKTLN